VQNCHRRDYFSSPERAPPPPQNVPDNQRGWRDFGTGALGAMGCHVRDGAFWALKLADATIFTIEADSTGLTGDC